MKVYRFLATLIVILLIGSGSKTNAQEITEFELRKTSPCLPFPATCYLSSLDEPIDDRGRALPINQCKMQYLPNQLDRCGFSASSELHVGLQPIQKEPVREIDLSPLRFECMEPAAENVELVKSANEFREEAESIALQNEQLAKEEVRRIIESVFTKDLSIDEVFEAPADPADGFAENDFELYVDPTTSIIPEPAIVMHTLADFRGLLAFWQNTITENAWVASPVETLHHELAELECRLCGSYLLNFVYSFQSAVQTARFQIERDKELAEIEQNVLIMQGFAKVIRVLGESLIDVSDSITAVHSKKVEGLSRRNDHIDSLK